MNLKQMQYIAEIEKCGSISKAAEKLYITQSGLNQQLKQIESELGIQLFKRTTHSLKITQAGRLVLMYTQDILHREDEMLQMLDAFKNGNTGEYHINLAMEEGIYLFAHVYQKFHEAYPLVTLKLEDHIVAEEYQLLADRKLDLGMIMTGNHARQDIQYIHLADEKLLLGVPRENPLAENYHKAGDGRYPIMPLEKCASQPFGLLFAGSTFREILDPIFYAKGFTPDIVFEARSYHILAGLAQAGFCLTIIPESQIKLYPDLQWYQLDVDPTWEGCLIYHKDYPPRKALRYYMKLCVEATREHGFFFD